MKDLEKILGTKRILYTVYHPQTDSQTKRINQEVKVFLQHYINYQQDDWTEWLSAAEFQYNNKKHTAREYILFELNFRKNLWKGDLTVKTELPKLKYFLEGLQRSWKVVKKSIKVAKEAMKKLFDKKRQNLQGLKKGDNI